MGLPQTTRIIFIAVNQKKRYYVKNSIFVLMLKSILFLDNSISSLHPKNEIILKNRIQKYGIILYKLFTNISFD